MELSFYQASPFWRPTYLAKQTAKGTACSQSTTDFYLGATPQTAPITFLQQVTQIDTSHYQATLLCNTVEQRSDLGGALEQIMTYSLTSSDSKLDVVFRFRNNQLSRYQIILLEGTPVYSVPQPFSVLDTSKGLLERLATYEGTPYLLNMSSLLSLVTPSTESIEIAEGNIKLNYTSQGDSAQILLMYIQNSVDFSPKSL